MEPVARPFKERGAAKPPDSYADRSDFTPSRSQSSMSIRSDISLPPMDGLSDEERAHIEAVMASAERDSTMSMPTKPQPTSDVVIPPGLEDLSEEERRQILAVMAAAGEDAFAPSPLPQPQMRRSGSATVTLPSPSPRHDSLPRRPHTAIGQPPPSWASTVGQSQSLSTMADPSICVYSSSTDPPAELPGLESLSAAEREQILAVMESARREESRPPSSVETRPPPSPLAASGLRPVTPEVMPLFSPMAPPGMEELSAEEREKIAAVMASAAMDEQMTAVSPAPPSLEPQQEPITAIVSSPPQPVVTEVVSESLAHSLSEHSVKELMTSAEKKKAAEAKLDSVISLAQEDERIATSPTWADEAIDSFGLLRDQKTPRDVHVRQERAAPAEIEPESSDEDLPGVDLSHLSPSEREQIRAVMRMAQMDDPGRREASQRAQFEKPEGPTKPDSVVEKKTRQTSMNSSSELGSPTRESGYGTTSTSYDHELGDFATKTERMYDVLEDTSEVRDGARSRNDSRADDRRDDFDFTYSDARFSEISDENFDQSSDLTGVAVELECGRRCSKVMSPNNQLMMSSYSTHPQKPLTRSTPEITVTVHDEKLDSEDEESGSEDDDEYPDKVVAAPIAPTPSYEEVERERQQQEQFGKEVLQQIQAFGEAADDEFDVQWAKSTLQRSQQKQEVIIFHLFEHFWQSAEKRGNIRQDGDVSSVQMPVVTMEEVGSLSSQKRDTPLELTRDEERRNPFLESPEDEDVSVDMEEVDVNRAAQFYQTHSLFCHRPGPVYTIPEDANECDGTIENTESRMIAREKKRQAARSVANSIIAISPASTSANQTISDIPPSISASIDKTMADIESLLDSVYTPEKSQPNLLYYDQKPFQQQPITTTTATATSAGDPEASTASSEASPLLLPLSKPLGSTLESVMAHPETDGESSPRGLKRSPGMMIPSDVFSGAKIHKVEPIVAKTTAAAVRNEVPAVDALSSELPNTFDELKSSYKWLREISEFGKNTLWNHTTLLPVFVPAAHFRTF
ncbi:unnamed protein product [Nippostrongylus brasiliensis]|uniref:ANK_REP_REGION domain-containing protein n=1 Tax=Nippostrongylus brasiliensis TaxID=27835 RepID=A0A158QXK8_NIPBR|nr:unnamed protein product [Nippostrongylus brasiliensis]